MGRAMTSRQLRRGPRSNAYSMSKCSNWSEFHPWHSSVVRAFERNLPATTDSTSRHPTIRIEKTHEDFLYPVSEPDLLRALDGLPTSFTEGLRGVLVLAGSKKQARVARRQYFYGAYWRECVFLAPFPRAFLDVTHRRAPNPIVLEGWRRAGVELTETPSGLRVRFEERSLRSFYLRDVLMHEIGHHVDRRRNVPVARSERFAEWFASEYGYRLPHLVRSALASGSLG